MFRGGPLLGRIYVLHHLVALAGRELAHEKGIGLKLALCGLRVLVDAPFRLIDLGLRRLYGENAARTGNKDRCKDNGINGKTAISKHEITPWRTFL
jgi:hypothetical protein